MGKRLYGQILPVVPAGTLSFSTPQAVAALTQLFAFQQWQGADYIIITCRNADTSANAATFTAETTHDAGATEEENPPEVTVAVGKTRQIKIGPFDRNGHVRLLVNSAGATVSYRVELQMDH